MSLLARARPVLLIALAAWLGACGDSEERAAPPTETSIDSRSLPSPPRRRPSKAPEAEREPATDSSVPESREELLGESVKGRPIRARVVGDSASQRSVLVVGCVHGDEPAGTEVTGALRDASVPQGVALWLVDDFNPDGCEAGTRQNANGVDLNRNSPWKWKPLEEPGSTYYSGTGPVSEPESRAITELIQQIQPAISIWYHQKAALVDQSGGDQAIEQRYAELVGLPYKYFGRYPGSITTWQNETFPDDTAFVVELPGGELSSDSVELHRDAVLKLIDEVG